MMQQMTVPCVDREEAIYLKLELFRRVPDLRKTGIEVCEAPTTTLIIHTHHVQSVQEHLHSLESSEVEQH